MSEIFGMLMKGVGVGAWAIGFAFALTGALPVLGVLFAVVAWILKIGAGASDRRED